MKLNKLLNKATITGLSAMCLVAAGVLVAPEASAQIETGLNAAGAQMDKGASVDGIIGNVVNLFLYVVGAVAVIMVIFGGFQFATSAGDASKAAKGRNTLLYALAGLVVAAFAYAIINFVLEEVS